MHLLFANLTSAPFPAKILPKRPARTRRYVTNTAIEPLTPDPLQMQTPPRSNTVSPVIVPGKFDAFHLGHRELARVASTIGSPTLMSFSGMAEALKWSPRSPVVAAIERDRILRSWSAAIGSTISWQVLPFNDIRDYSPEQFVDMLSDRFGACGIVCGEDWRFGRRAAGDVGLLKRLADERGLKVSVAEAVDVADGVVSSTRVRKALARGDVLLAKRLMGRPHRLVGYVGSLGESWVGCNKFVNQVPGDGVYLALVRVIGACAPFHASVTVKRPVSVDPMTPIALLDDPDEVIVRIHEAEHIYCNECEVYLDFLEQLG